jgi:hypothetical protein
MRALFRWFKENFVEVRPQWVELYRAGVVNTRAVCLHQWS